MYKANIDIKDHITIICEECGGEGRISSCCNNYVDGNKCAECGKFCRTEICIDCHGEGDITYHVDDDVEIFVGNFSSTHIKENLFWPKNYDDFKIFRGKITRIINDSTVEVKIKRKGIYDIDIHDITGI